MAKKLNRVDVLFALNNQFSALPDSMPSMEGSGMLMMLDEIRPVVDISRPSKIPYADWRAGSVSSDGATIIAGKSKRRIIVTHMSLRARNTAITTGVSSTIQGTINGNTVPLLSAALVPSADNAVSMVSDCEIVLDSGTALTYAEPVALAVALASATGYYVDA